MTKRLILASAFVASIVLPFAASAQMSDSAYCQALSDSYRKVIGSSPSTAAGVPEAMAGCQSTPAKSIPVLEKALTDQKATLPKRT